MTITLEIVGPYPLDGYQAENGAVHLNDTVYCPEGVVSNLQTHLAATENDEIVLVIDAAPTVTLVSDKPVEEWNADAQIGARKYINGFGFELFELSARNGKVIYIVRPDDVVWKDEPDKHIGQRVAVRTAGDFTPEGPVPSQKKRTVTTKDLKLVDPNTIPGGKL